MTIRFEKGCVNTNKQSAEDPAIAYLNGVLYMLRKDVGSDAIWFCKYEIPSDRADILSGNWTKSVKTGNNTNKAPALVAYEGKLFAAWKGYGSNTLYCGFVNKESGKIEDVEKIDGSESSDGPTLSVNYDKVFLWHTGESAFGQIYRNKYTGSWSGDKQVTVKGESDPKSLQAPSASCDGKGNIALFFRGIAPFPGTAPDVYRMFYLKEQGRYGEVAVPKRDGNFLVSKIPPTVFHSFSEKATYAFVKVENKDGYDFKDHEVHANQLVLLQDLDPKGVNYKFHQALEYEVQPKWLPSKINIPVETDKRVAVAVIEGPTDQVILMFKEHDSNYIRMMAST